MADRRMFAKTIIDSDDFLDMPMSAQALYFHLSMRADDDGFLNNPRRIQRDVGASADDLRLLIAKKYLITFESGVVVIRHWKIHNYIQKDRYKPTLYEEEKEMLEFKSDKNKEYVLKDSSLDTVCIQDVSNTDTQVRLGKVRLGKDRLEERESALTPPAAQYEDFEEEETEVIETENPTQRINYKQVALTYNKICESFPTCTQLSTARKKQIKICFDNGLTLEDFEKAFTKAQASSFMKGNNQRGWKATFDWITKYNNICKILDGNYDDKEPDPQQTQTSPSGYRGTESLDDFNRRAAAWAEE